MIISATFSKPVKNIQDILGRPYLRMKIRAANNSNNTSYMVEAFTEKQAFHEQKTETELNTFIENTQELHLKTALSVQNQKKLQFLETRRAKQPDL